LIGVNTISLAILGSKISAGILLIRTLPFPLEIVAKARQVFLWAG
jgi:hypothetical protein